uniref:Uncharacterized protein n=1 Tax=Candidatus Kentrum sp. SD TaxID=2126332 RepID=A0A450YQN4_9GAMM|nr:MAG: hypothetical protein BECKSD772F_GA0070984_11577 [Candidatus Kentron sp. SD]VFK48988.1 MAG: hypothetical protein BECKSD772E_GA0070983_11537 [Candidatus Kentron sp. SD]
MVLMSVSSAKKVYIPCATFRKITLFNINILHKKLHTGAHRS